MSRALELFAVEPAGTLGINAPLMLYTRYSEMIYFAAHIHDVNNVSELHSMRIAAKRLRYTLEVFAPAFGRVNAEYLSILNEIKGVQEQIGDIHDCDIRIAQIVDYLNQNIVKKPEIRSGLSNLIDLETSTRGGLYTKFAAHWEELARGGGFERKFVETIFSARTGFALIKESVPARKLSVAASARKKTTA